MGRNGIRLDQCHVVDAENRLFFSLVELSTAIRDCVTAINAKIMRRIGKSRNELLETIDRPALNALPTTPYGYAEWKRARVAPDYHIEVADHYYSVPSTLIREMDEGGVAFESDFAFRVAQQCPFDELLRHRIADRCRD